MGQENQGPGKAQLGPDTTASEPGPLWGRKGPAEERCWDPDTGRPHDVTIATCSARGGCVQQAHGCARPAEERAFTRSRPERGRRAAQRPRPSVQTQQPDVSLSPG